jgi:hypothetical protein
VQNGLPVKQTTEVTANVMVRDGHTIVIGGLFRSLGQEADAVGSTYALERRDVMSPLIRNLGSMLVKGATPVEVLRQYMAKGDSPTRGRELNIHFGDLERGFIGQISPLGDLIPVMAGVTLSFRQRGEDRVGMVYIGDGATSTGAFHEGLNLAAVQRLPVGEQPWQLGRCMGERVRVAGAGNGAGRNRPAGLDAPTAWGEQGEDDGVPRGHGRAASRPDARQPDRPPHRECLYYNAPADVQEVGPRWVSVRVIPRSLTAFVSSR